MAKVYAPNSSFNGISAGVRFANGVGECDDPNLLNWFRERGYRVEDEAGDTKGKGKGKGKGDTTPTAESGETADDSERDSPAEAEDEEGDPDATPRS